MAGTIQNIVKKSLDPVIWFGGLCMLVSGGWLLYEDQWRSMWMAGMAFVMSPFIFPLLMIPAGFCAGVMMVTEKPFPKASRVFAVLTFVWFITLMSGYPVVSLMATGDAIHAGYKLPAIVWALAAGLTPWAFFATRDRGNVFFTGLVFMSAVTGAVLFPLAAHEKWDMSRLFWTYWLALGVFVSIEALYEKFFFKPPADAAAPAADTPAADTTANEAAANDAAADKTPQNPA